MMRGPEEVAANVNLLSGTSIFMTLAGQTDIPPAALEWDGHDGTWDGHDDCPDEGCDHLKMRSLRTKLLEEEYTEYQDKGENVNDLVETVDGLLDIVVIAWGSLIAYIGSDAAEDCAREVTRSNLAKVIGEGLPIFREDGKVIKPEGWTGPDIAGVLKHHGFLQ